MGSTGIRKCRPSDLPDVQPLFDDLYSEQEHHEQQTLAERMSEFFLVAEEGGHIIGFAVGQRREAVNLKDEMGKDAFPNDSEYLEVQDLYVVPDRRGRGLGTKLMKALLDRARQRGLNRSMVYSANADYARIAHFYEKLGYRMWHIFMTK